MPKTQIVSSKELGTTCWSACRFCGGTRCPRVMDCNYPERKSCKAVQTEIDYLNKYYSTEIEKMQRQYEESMSKLGGG